VLPSKALFNSVSRIERMERSMAETISAPKSTMQRFLDAVERAGNMVPHPVVIFLILIGLVMVASVVLSLFGASATLERIDPATNQIVKTETTVRSLLDADGIRFLYESLIPNFMAFTAVGLLIGVMIGAGVMEESGLVKTAIRRLVMVAPTWALSYIVAFVGILSSLAADAGYLVLLPLAGAAFASVRRHPLAGLALAYAAVAGAFTVNMMIKPLDAVLVQLTNDAIHIIDPNKSISLTSNLWFAFASVVFLTVLVGFLTDRVVEPRLGKYTPDDAAEGGDAESDEAQTNELTPAESRGLRFAGLGVLALLAVFALLTFPRWAPLRAPQEDGWGAIIGNSPFMNGLIGLVILLFLVSGWCYG
jgi:aminobenzoyl-glutamate transport protein